MFLDSCRLLRWVMCHVFSPFGGDFSPPSSKDFHLQTDAGWNKKTKGKIISKPKLRQGGDTSFCETQTGTTVLKHV